MTQPLPSQEAKARTAPEQAVGVSPADGPESRRRWRTVLIAVAALVVVGGILFLVSDLGEDSNRGAAEPTEQGETQDGDTAEPGDPDGGQAAPSQPTEELPVGSVVGEGSIAGSLARAEAFMDAVVMGDLQGALGLGGADFRDRYDGDEAKLATALTEAAGGVLPDNYAIESLDYDAVAEADAVALRVTLPDGNFDRLVVMVGEENGAAVVVGLE